jgi:type II secretory pathway pseudopilin PulG
MKRVGSLPLGSSPSSGCGGFSLGEVLIAILCLGLLLAPFLVTVTSLPTMQRQLGFQARNEAWRSVQDHALSAGIDPGHAVALQAGTNPSIPSVDPEPVERGASTMPPVGVALRVLRNAPGTKYPEDRPGGSGWELSRGAALEAAVPPAPPLLPLTMRVPDLLRRWARCRRACS